VKISRPKGRLKKERHRPWSKPFEGRLHLISFSILPFLLSTSVRRIAEWIADLLLTQGGARTHRVMDEETPTHFTSQAREDQP